MVRGENGLATTRRRTLYGGSHGGVSPAPGGGAQGLRFAYETFERNKVRYDAGRAPAADFYQSRGQYELFRAQRTQASLVVLERERQLRTLLGLSEDGGPTRLVPGEVPTTTK